MKLYRVFRELTHAEQLLSGELRFGNLGYYRALESSSRGDRTEGRAHHVEYRADRKAVRIAGGEGREVASPGLVSVRTECGNEIFVSCFTRPPDVAAWERVRKEFGDVVVEIDSAEKLLEDVRGALDDSDPWQRGARVMLWPVEYTKGLEQPASAARDPVKLAVTQKPPSYSHQHEYRFALISFAIWQEHGGPPEFINVRLRRGLDYARVVADPVRS